MKLTNLTLLSVFIIVGFSNPAFCVDPAKFNRRALLVGSGALAVDAVIPHSSFGTLNEVRPISRPYGSRESNGFDDFYIHPPELARVMKEVALELSISQGSTPPSPRESARILENSFVTRPMPVAVEPSLLSIHGRTDALIRHLGSQNWFSGLIQVVRQKTFLTLDQLNSRGLIKDVMDVSNVLLDLEGTALEKSKCEYTRGPKLSVLLVEGDET